MLPTRGKAEGRNGGPQRSEDSMAGVTHWGSVGGRDFFCGGSALRFLAFGVPDYLA